MRKFILILLLPFLLTRYEAFAEDAVQRLEKQVRSQNKVMLEKCGKSPRKLKGEEKVDCLLETIEFLNLKNELYYHYYENSLSILNIYGYNGALKNSKY